MASAVKMMDFGDDPPMDGKEVTATKQLDPSMGPEPYATGVNKEERYTTKTKGVGELGMQGFCSDGGGGD